MEIININRPAAALLLATILCSCQSSYDVSKIPEASHPEDAGLMLSGVKDPLEPVNRVSFELNTALFEHVLYPILKGYCWLVPEPGREKVSNFHNNLIYPVRLVNNSLQWQWEESWIETKRFGLNSTVGILGFNDAASIKYELQPSNEDLGQTFGKWGWNSQAYLFIPIIGPSSERDALGMVGDSFLKPTSLLDSPYNFLAEGFLTFNDMSAYADTVHDALLQNYDSYQLARLLYGVSREAAVNNFAHDDMADDTAETQTLRAIFAAPESKSFKRSSIDDSVMIEGWKQPLPYSIWLQDEPAPLMIQLPGLGSHRKGNMDLALAELAFNEGYSVLVFSNTFNWEFMTSAPTGYAPGYIEKDKELLRIAYQAIMKNVYADYGEAHFLNRSLIGMSMGAWYTLNLAADLKAYGSAHFVDHCIAINPPVNLLQGLSALDTLYRAPLIESNGDLDQAKAIIDSAISKALISAKSGNLMPTSSMPFTNAEASYLIGLNFRMTLHEAIIAGAFDQKLSVFGSKGALYKDMAGLSFNDYYKKIVLPVHESQGVALRDLDRSIDLQNRTADLRAVEGLHLVLSKNDFLLKQSDLDWFKANFSMNSTVFNQGGHLGELWRPELREVIQDQLRKIK